MYYLSITEMVCCAEYLFIFIVFWPVGWPLFSDDKGSDILLLSAFISGNAAAIRQHSNTTVTGNLWSWEFWSYWNKANATNKFQGLIRRFTQQQKLGHWADWDKTRL